MGRLIELQQISASFSRQINEAQALVKAAGDIEAYNRAQQVLAELYVKRSEVKQELRTICIAEGEKLREELKKRPKRDPPPLTTATIERLQSRFTAADQPAARELLLHFSDQRFCDKPTEAERVWIAAIKESCGNLAVLAKAIETANADYRDLLLQAGFASDMKAHLRWWPGQPAHWYARRLPPPSS